MIPIIKNPRQEMLYYWLVPSALLIAVVWFDYFFLPGATVTPMCSLLILGLMAMFYPRTPMTVWAIVFSAASIYTVCHPETFMHGPRNMPMVHLFRSVSVVGAGIITVMFCSQRIQANAKSEQIEFLMRELSVPLVLSDANGEIIFVNEQAAMLLGVESKDAAGDSYFSLATDADEKGTAIQHYLALIDGCGLVEATSTLKPRHSPGVVLEATMRAVDGLRGRCMITIIKEKQPSLALA